MKLDTLSDNALLSALTQTVLSERTLVVQTVLYLIEVEERRLHLKLAYSSLFDFCRRRLGLSEGESFRRMTAAKLVRRFPTLLGRLERGELHLSGLAMLRNAFTEANCEELAAEATGKTKRQIEELIARRWPKPDVPTTLRRLPTPASAAPSAVPAPLAPSASLAARSVPASADEASHPDVVRANAAQLHRDPSRAAPVPTAMSTPTPAPVPLTEPATTSPMTASATTSPMTAPPALSPHSAAVGAPNRPAPPATLEPLAPERYKLQLTASRALRDKLERARDLMRHKHPSGDFASIIEDALDELLAKLEKRRVPSAVRSQKPRPSKSGYIPAADRRTVFARGEQQCTFVNDKGNRCPARAFLQLDHIEARARGGPGEPPNLRSLCFAHNQLHAEQTFGRDYVEQKINMRRRKSMHDPPRTSQPSMHRSPSAMPPSLDSPAPPK